MQNRRKAFTIVELLVVIAIIMVLVALLFPSLRNARERATSIVCMNNLRELAILSRTYTVEHDGWWPSAPPRVCRDGLTNQTFTTWRITGTWWYKLAQVMGKEFEPCGADSNALAIVKAMPTFYCPKVTSKDPLANFCSLVPLVWFNAYPGNPGTGDQQTKVSSNPSKYPLAGDGNVGGITKPDLKIDKYAMPMFRHGSTYRTPDSSYQYPSPGDTQLRGDGVANIIFCDGRVESFTRTRWDNAVASQEILLSKP